MVQIPCIILDVLSFYNYRKELLLVTMWQCVVSNFKTIMRKLSNNCHSTQVATALVTNLLFSASSAANAAELALIQCVIFLTSTKAKSERCPFQESFSAMLNFSSPCLYKVCKGPYIDPRCLYNVCKGPYITLLWNSALPAACTIRPIGEH